MCTQRERMLLVPVRRLWLNHVTQVSGPLDMLVMMSRGFNPRRASLKYTTTCYETFTTSPSTKVVVVEVGWGIMTRVAVEGGGKARGEAARRTR